MGQVSYYLQSLLGPYNRVKMQVHLQVLKGANLKPDGND